MARAEILVDLVVGCEGEHTARRGNAVFTDNERTVVHGSALIENDNRII